MYMVHHRRHRHNDTVKSVYFRSAYGDAAAGRIIKLEIDIILASGSRLTGFTHGNAWRIRQF